MSCTRATSIRRVRSSKAEAGEEQPFGLQTEGVGRPGGACSSGMLELMSGLTNYTRTESVSRQFDWSIADQQTGLT